MPPIVEDLGQTKNLDVIQRFISLHGKSVVDIGCGSMTFTRVLADLGANVLAIDPDPVQSEKNREMDKIPNVRFAEVSAECIPTVDNSLDGCFFSYSLHHIPAEIYPQVFSEARRVLKPDGFLYIIEPTDCPLNEVMRLFHNEDVERAAAQTAIESLAAPHFQIHDRVKYYDIRRYASFEEFATHFSNQSFNSLYAESDVWSDEVRLAFERFGQPNYEFTSPKQVAFLQNLKAVG